MSRIKTERPKPYALPEILPSQDRFTDDGQVQTLCPACQTWHLQTDTVVYRPVANESLTLYRRRSYRKTTLGVTTALQPNGKAYAAPCLIVLREAKKPSVFDIPVVRTLPARRVCRACAGRRWTPEPGSGDGYDVL